MSAEGKKVLKTVVILTIVLVFLVGGLLVNDNVVSADGGNDLGNQSEGEDGGGHPPCAPPGYPDPCDP